MQQGLKEILCARTTNCPSTVKHVIELSYFGFWITERKSNFQNEFQKAKKKKKKIQKIQNPKKKERKKNKERKLKIHNKKHILVRLLEWLVSRLFQQYINYK